MTSSAPILVVDTDPALRSEVIATLARAKITNVIAAGTAKEACLRLEDFRPKAAFVDFELSETGGLTAAFQIIARARVLHLVMPVFLIAPIGGDAIDAAAQAIGAAGVIA